MSCMTRPLQPPPLGLPQFEMFPCPTQLMRTISPGDPRLSLSDIMLRAGHGSMECRWQLEVLRMSTFHIFIISTSILECVYWTMHP